jgi:2,6-dihydroxypyridine 3-monooxygenase
MVFQLPDKHLDGGMTGLQTSSRYVQYVNRDGEVYYREERPHSYTAWGVFYRALLSDFGLEHYHLGDGSCRLHSHTPAWR